METVSYTHLDVYKRQIQVTADEQSIDLLLLDDLTKLLKKCPLVVLSLIHIYADAACMMLDNLRQSQRKRQRSLKAFPA